MSAVAGDEHPDVLTEDANQVLDTTLQETPTDTNITSKTLDIPEQEESIPPLAESTTTDEASQPITATYAEDNNGEELTYALKEDDIVTDHPTIPTDNEAEHKDIVHEEQPFEPINSTSVDGVEDTPSTDATSQPEEASQLISSGTPEDAVVHEEGEIVPLGEVAHKHASDVALAVESADGATLTSEPEASNAATDEPIPTQAEQEPTPAQEPITAKIFQDDVITSAPAVETAEQTDIQDADVKVEGSIAPESAPLEEPVVAEKVDASAGHSVVALEEPSATETPEAGSTEDHQGAPVAPEESVPLAGSNSEAHAQSAEQAEPSEATAKDSAASLSVVDPEAGLADAHKQEVAEEITVEGAALVVEPAEAAAAVEESSTHVVEVAKEEEEVAVEEVPDVPDDKEAPAIHDAASEEENKNVITSPTAVAGGVGDGTDARSTSLPCAIDSEKLIILASADETCFGEPDDSLVSQAAQEASASKEEVLAEDESVHSKNSFKGGADVPDLPVVTAEEPENVVAVSEHAEVIQQSTAATAPASSDEPEVADFHVTATPVESVHVKTAETTKEIEFAEEVAVTTLPEADTEVQEDDKKSDEQPENAVKLPSTSAVTVEHEEVSPSATAEIEAPVFDVVQALDEIIAVEHEVSPEISDAQEAQPIGEVNSELAHDGEPIVESDATASISEEIPAISVTALVEEVQAPGEQELPEPERPKSPPSYSVSAQGPEVTVDQQVAEAPIEISNSGNDTEQAEAAVAQQQPQEIVEPSAAAEATQSWPVSYSVSSQGTSPLQTPQETHEGDVEAIETLSPAADDLAAACIVPPIEHVVAKEAEASVETDETALPKQVADVESSEPLPTPQIVAIDEDSHSIEQVVIPGGPDDEPVVPVHEAPVELAPQRPWTPSYAVSQQGPTRSATELPAETELATPVMEAPAARPTWTPSYSVSRQGSVSSLREAEVTITEKAEPAQDAATAPVPEAANVETESLSEVKADEVVPPVVEEIEVKPSWTPSYSISRQGSKASLRGPEISTTNEESAVTVTDTASHHITSEPEDIVPKEEETSTKSPCTPSYSVSRQGSRSSLREPSPISSTPAPAVDPTPSFKVVSEPEPEVVQPTPVVSDVPVVEEAKSDEQPDQERPWTPSYSVSRQGTSPAKSPVDLPQVSVEAEKPEEVKEEQERPFTPSYSVTRQGSSPLLQATEESQEPAVVTPEIRVEEVANSPVDVAPVVQDVPLVEGPAAKTTTESAPQWTPSYAVSRQGSSPKIEPAELPAPAEEDAQKDEPPARPWTPSYSVTIQGPASPVTNGNGVADDDEERQAFPTTEVHENGPKVSLKPSLARLAPVDEHAPTHIISPAQLEEPQVVVSPTGKRARHESSHSSASSRFFPGGWFSGNPKSPEDNRASLDHATGEFTRRDGKANGKAAIEDAEGSGATAPVNTPVEGVKHEKKKSRGCVIM